MNAPLEGVRVIDLTRVLAGPLATMLLGDLGADVIKVERPETGDDTRGWGPPYQRGESAYFLGVNRNKRSITVNAQNPEGRRLLARLLGDADIVVDNFRRGTLDGWGFDDAWFHEHAPAAVRCSITGYGAGGPKADEPGYDFILQAESGLMSITGEHDGQPMKVGVALVDICTGLLAAISMLSGLQGRTTSAHAPRFEVSLHDTSLMMLANVASNFLVSGEAPARYGNGHPNIVPYRTFNAADGQLAVAVGNDQQFRKLATALGHPEWTQDPRFETNADRVANRNEVDAMVDTVFRTRSREHWTDTLRSVGIPVGPINTVMEALEATQTTDRGIVTDVDHPDTGAIRLLGSALGWGGTPAPVRLAPPRLGEHLEQVLVDELGLTHDEVAKLREVGAV